MLSIRHFATVDQAIVKTVYKYIHFHYYCRFRVAARFIYGWVLVSCDSGGELFSFLGDLWYTC